MSENKETEKIEVKYKPGSPDRTRTVASKLQEIFNGPIFEKMVRDAVEEMILEGKLTYDMKSDTIDVPEDIVKAWAAVQEKSKWSRKKGSSPSKK